MPIRRLFWIILISGFIVKFPALFRPLTGYFGSYQATNGMFAEMMLRGHWLDIRSFALLDGAPALYLLYYPFASFSAAIFKIALHLPVDFGGRLQAALLMAASAALFYEIVKKGMERSSAAALAERIAVISLLFFTFSPLNLIMGIQFQNEASAVFFLLLSVYFMICRESGLCIFFAGFSFSLAVVARLHFLFVSPLFLALLGEKRVRNFSLLVLGGIIPITLWFGYVRFMEIHHAGQIMTSIFNQAGEGRVLKNVFTESGFYKQLLKTLLGPLATPGIFVLSLIGFWKTPKDFRFFQFWLLGAFATIFILPQKVWDHPFYLIAAVPPLAFFGAWVTHIIFQRFSPRISTAFIALFFLLSLRYYMPPAFSDEAGFEIRAIGNQIQRLTNTEDRVIAERGTTPELLFYTNRAGWEFDLLMAQHPFGDQQKRHLRLLQQGYGDPVRWLEKLRAEGARYLIITSLEIFEGQRSFREYVSSRYRDITPAKNSFRIFDLKTA